MNVTDIPDQTLQRCHTESEPKGLHLLQSQREIAPGLQPVRDNVLCGMLYDFRVTSQIATDRSAEPTHYLLHVCDGDALVPFDTRVVEGNHGKTVEGTTTPSSHPRQRMRLRNQRTPNMLLLCTRQSGSAASGSVQILLGGITHRHHNRNARERINEHRMNFSHAIGRSAARPGRLCTSMRMNARSSTCVVRTASSEQ